VTSLSPCGRIVRPGTSAGGLLGGDWQLDAELLRRLARLTDDQAGAVLHGGIRDRPKFIARLVHPAAGRKRLG
jgi:hypothetical protein